MPQFGWTHDDGVYFTCGKALASGEGYRIASLPDQPWQTKYPPLYPLLLSAVWRISPQFPDNLQLASLMSWLFLPATMMLVYWLYGHFGFSRVAIWTMLAFLALNPYVHFFSISLLSEFPFLLLLLAVFLLAPRRPVLGGLLAGLAYLTRTAGVPLLIVIPGLLLWRRQTGDALKFALAMLPFVAGWMGWSAAHRSVVDDPYLMYYLDYVWYERYVINAGNILTVVWKNFDSVLTGIGTFIVPTVDNPAEKALAWTLAVGAIIGVYKLVRARVEVLPYAIYAVCLALMLIFWHYPSNPRFLFPIFPLLLAGLAYQVQLTFMAIRKVYLDGTQRGAAIVVSTMLAGVAAVVVWSNVNFLLSAEPGFYRNQRAARDETVSCLRAGLPEGAKVLTNKDALVYLITNRWAMRMNIPPQYWYEDRMKDAVQEIARVEPYARSHGLTHLFYSTRVEGDLSSDQQAKLIRELESSVGIKVSYRCGNATLYELLRP